MKRSRKTAPDVNRRNFLKGSSVATLMSMLGGIELRAQSAPEQPKKPEGPKVKVGVIGLGAWGRDILATLGRLPQAEVATICDTYAASIRRSKNNAPNAATTEDYRTILDNKEITGVIIATPTHKHKDVVLAALQAGKHVYCEAPLAHTVEDARAIALAAKANPKLYFQAGLQLRADPQRHFLMDFVRSGAIGPWVMVRSQWHKKQMWRQDSPNADRLKDLNWRLDKDISPGLAGEIGVHHFDSAGWFLGAQPTAVTGFGSVRRWTEDGRKVADTIQTVFEYPGGVQLMYDCTLANSFETAYEMFYGSDAAVMLRGNKAWLFKEVDSPLLGWEVYARKDRFGEETGIALVANATKIAAQGDNPIEDAPFTNTPLFYSLENFLANASAIGGAVEDFVAAFDPKDIGQLKAHLAEVRMQPYAGFVDGYAATVIGLKANEAVKKGEKVAIKKEWLTLA
ncbi:MAG TPA: Gfo/Idh/MocA family oxidoreductase [Verrucomicrobiae bacterium]|nr:Gfo/Idh/MocA family oxidoreductase [Verrucomicrobiae bacterium]